MEALCALLNARRRQPWREAWCVSRFNRVVGTLEYTSRSGWALPSVMVVIDSLEPELWDADPAA